MILPHFNIMSVLEVIYIYFSGEVEILCNGALQPSLPSSTFHVIMLGNLKSAVVGTVMAWKSGKTTCLGLIYCFVDSLGLRT